LRLCGRAKGESAPSVGGADSFTWRNMHFFRDSLDQDASSLIPSRSFLLELQDCNAITEKVVDDLCLHDIVFDIKFLKISEKQQLKTFDGVGYAMKAHDTNDNSYSAFILGGLYVHLVNPDYHDYIYQSLDDALLFPN